MHLLVLVSEIDVTSVIDLVLHLSTTSDGLVVALKGLVVLPGVLLESVVRLRLFVEQWLDVDVTVHAGATQLALVLALVLLLVTLAEGLSVVEVGASGLLREVVLKLLGRGVLAVLVALLTSMESRVMLLVLRLLDQEVVQEGSFEVLVLMLLFSVTMVEGLKLIVLTVEVKSLRVVLV
jgi:hypothetical protein